MNYVRRKFPQLKLFVIICYLSVFTSPGARPVSLAQASTQGYIKKEINSPAKSIPNPVRPKDLIAVPTKDIPVAHEATISGIVLDDLGNPLAGTTVVGVNPLKPEETFQTTTNAQGQYNLSVVFKGKAEETIQDFQVDIFKEGYTPKQEEAEVVATRVEGLGTSILKTLDTKITKIGASGGTHTNSRGDVQVVVPAGAVTRNVDFRATLFDHSTELPGQLPVTSFFTYSGDFDAEETQFGEEVTVKIANTLGFAPGTEIPIGYYNEETRVWEDSGQMSVVDSTGAWVEYDTTHFSVPDCNLPALPPPEAQAPTGSTEGPVENHSASTNINRDDIASNCNASKIDMHTGNLYQEHFLPSLHAMNQDITLKLVYISTTAQPSVLLATQTDLDSRYSLQPETQSATFEIEGISQSATFKNTFGKNAERFLWDGKNAKGELVSTGSYPYKITLSNDYIGTYYTADSFGGDPIEDTGVPTRETIPETTIVTGRSIVNNQINSSFGSGWNLANLKRLYPDPDGRVLLVEGDGSSLVFDPPHEDIVTANSYSYDVSVLLGNGDGTFQREKRFGAGHHPFSVAVGDFNEDDYQDMVTANWYSDDVSVLLGNGDGTFQAEKRFGAGDSPFSVAVGNFNEDGYQDLVTANGGDDTVSVFLGNGDGTFQTEKRFGARGYPFSVAIGDFNEDGYQDLVTADWYSDDVSVLLGNGDGTFQAEKRFGAGDSPFFVAVGNFNKDGHEDFVTVNGYTFENISILLGNGDGTFQTEKRFGAGDYPESVAIGDFNEDSYQDLVTANYYDDTVSVLLGNGDGTFQAERRFGAGDYPSSVAVGNFNEDGYQDLVTVNWDSNDVSVLLGKGDGNFQPQMSFGIGDAPHSVAIGHFNANSEIGEYEPPPGDYSKLKKNSDGTFKLTEKNGTVSKFNAKGLLAFETDRNGNTIAYTYNTDDSLQTITYLENVTFTFVYNSSTKKLESVTDSSGRNTQFVVDSSGNLTQIINPDGTSKSYTYDSEHLMTTKTEENGNTTDYLYDKYGRINETQTPEYDVWNGSSVVRDRVSTQYFPSDVKGLINDLTVGTPDNPASLVDPTTLTDEITGACGCSSKKGYTNAFGSWTESQDGLGQKTKFTRDSENNISRIEYPNGRIVDMTYDGKGNLLTAKESYNSATTTFTYEPTFNQVASIMDPLGYITTISYDSQGNPIQIVDAATTTTEMTYDSRGLLTSLTQAKGIADLENTTTFSYDPTTGNLLTTTDPLTHQTVLIYDSAGNLKTILDAEGKTTAYNYDSKNNHLTSVKDHLGNLTQYQYDDLGNLTEVIDPKLQTTTFAYNELHLLSSILNPLNKLKTFTYDIERRLGRIVDAKNQTIKFEYDAAHQLKKKYLPEETVRYTYDTGGNLLSAKDSDSYVSFTFDAMNRLTKAQTLSGGVQPITSISYTYDSNNNRATMVDVGGATFKYVYDNLNRLTDIENFAGTTTFTHYVYDVLSRRTGLTYPNSAYTSYSYDLASQLSNLTNKTGSTTNSSYSYTYNDVGYRDTMTTTAGRHNYTYDDLYRLSVADYPDSTDESFSYDEVGNRISSAFAGPLTLTLSPFGRGKLKEDSSPWQYNTANQLTDDGTYTYEYDNNGNLTKRTKKSDSSVTTYTYNSENQLTQITSGSNTYKYAYDGLGRRIQKDVSGTITKYVYDNEDIVAEYAGTSTTPAATYLHGHGIDEPIYMSRSGVTYYYHADGLGSITELTNSTGTVSQSYKYDAFGNILSQTGSLVNPFTYTGREFDAESGLYFYRARYMDPKIGRFLQEDPIGFEGGDINLYPYTFNSPINFTDPSGLIVPGDPDPSDEIAILLILKKVATKGIRWVKNNIQIDGPLGMRICQIRFKKQPIIRLDYGPYKGTHGKPRLHLHFPKLLPDVHIPLDPRILFD